MKKIKIHYATIILLVVFIGAFLSQSLSCFGTPPNSNISSKHPQSRYIHSLLEVVNSFGNDLFENETEDDFDLLHFSIPQYHIDFKFEAAHSQLAYFRAIPEKPTNPIYIMVCNFRI